MGEFTKVSTGQFTNIFTPMTENMQNSVLYWKLLIILLQAIYVRFVPDQCT
jgi:hypothetical protein